MSQNNAPPTIPSTGYLRLPQIIGTLAASPRKKAAFEKEGYAEKPERKTEAAFYQPLIPVSRSTWFAGVRSGRYPAPVHHLGERITAWRAEDILAFIERSSEY